MRISDWSADVCSADLTALLDILGVVVCSADPVRIGMRQLGVHPHLQIAELIERGRDRRADAMPGQLILVTHALERAIEGVLADWPLQAILAREQINLSGIELRTHVANNLHGQIRRT